MLVREEIALAKAEVTDKVTKLGKGAGIAAAAGVFLVFAVTMFFHFFSWFLNDLFDWNSVWPGFGSPRCCCSFSPRSRLHRLPVVPEGRAAPDMAIEQAKLTRASSNRETIERDQVKRTLERARRCTSG